MYIDNNRNAHFEISERKVLLRIIDILIVLFMLYLGGKVFDFAYFQQTITSPYSVILLSLYISFFGTIFDMYHLPVTISGIQITRSVFLTASAVVLVYFLTPFLSPGIPHNRVQIIYFYSIVLFSLLLWRWLYIKLFASHRFVKRAIIICGSKQLNKLVDLLEKADPHYKVTGYLDMLSTGPPVYVNDIKPIVKINDMGNFIEENGIYEVIIAPDADISPIHADLLQLMEKGILIKDYSYAYELLSNKIPVELIEGDFYRYFPFSRSNHNRLYLLLVRGGEIIFSITGLLLSSFFLLPVIFIGNMIGNKGSLFYKQERVGKNGKIFNIIKFRTMVKDAEKEGAVFAKKNDARITPFGKFLRKSRIDELPQLINVLKGNMSVIGPRPERAYFVEQITEKMPLYPARHAIKPGLTGWAQVNYSYGDSIDDSIEKLKYDLFYIKHRSVFLDINIVVKTIGTILFYKGQ